MESQRVSNGNEMGSRTVGEAHNVGRHWYERPAYRLILVISILFVCGLVGAVVALAILLSRSEQSASPPASNTLQPEMIACNFLSIPNITRCRSTVRFDSFYNSDTTTGFAIPSEIGLLKQLTYLHLYSNSLTSTIPSEIGRLTNLVWLSLWNNELTSTIPSEIGQLTQLVWLDFSTNSLTSTIPSDIRLLTRLTALGFSNNELKGTMPSSICSIPSLASSIYIDCGEITCDSGCCWDYDTFSSCGSMNA